jgi:uncharacterized repeat protein (TIGR04052 family)
MLDCMKLADCPLVVLLVGSLAAVGCGDDATTTVPQPFALRFAALANGQPVTCTTAVPGVGPGGSDTVGLSDLRFYVSDLRFLDVEGNLLAATIDANEFQHQSDAGSVSLVDLTGNAEGSCADTAIAQAEGTARTHEAITGTLVGEASSVEFSVGVPQQLMKQTIASSTPEGAPSPLNEMYWNWASGYRHFVLNFTIDDAESGEGAGYVHLGSRNCGPEDGLALEDRDACEFVNTPAVALEGIDLATDIVALDLPRVLSGVDFVSPIYDTATFDVIGEGPGVECHSSPAQPDCASVFANLGLDMASGQASASDNAVFSIATP